MIETEQYAIRGTGQVSRYPLRHIGYPISAHAAPSPDARGHGSNLTIPVRMRMSVCPLYARSRTPLPGETATPSWEEQTRVAGYAVRTLQVVCGERHASAQHRLVPGYRSPRRIQYDGDPRWCNRAFRIPRCVLNRRVKVHDENWWPPSPFGEQRDPFFHCSNWAMARRHKIALTDPRPRIFSPEGA